MSTVVILTGCGRGDEEGSIYAVEAFRFDNLPEMVATAHVVAIGEIRNSRPGPSFGDPHDPSETIELTLRVDELLYGNASGDVTILEDTDVARVVGHGYAQSQIGDRGFYFLQRLDPAVFGVGENVFTLLNSQGRYLIKDGRLAGANREDPFVRRIERMNPEELRAKIKEAREKVERGEVEPQEPPS